MSFSWCLVQQNKVVETEYGSNDNERVIELFFASARQVLVPRVRNKTRRLPMPRRGWKSMEVPTGWVQILRGPRAAITEVAHGTTRAASASATGQPSAARSSSSHSPSQSGRQPRRSSLEGGEIAASTRGDGGHGWRGRRVLEGGASSQCRGRRMQEIHRQVREAPCRFGSRARIGVVCFDRRQGTSSEVGGRADSANGRGPLFPQIGRPKWKLCKRR